MDNFEAAPKNKWCMKKVLNFRRKIENFNKKCEFLNEIMNLFLNIKTILAHFFKLTS